MRPSSALAASLLVLAAVSPVPAQLIINGNGGQIFIQGTYNGQATKPEPDPAGPHLVQFFDGRQLHGTLDSLDLGHQELTWRRADADTPIVIPTREISRLSFDLTSQQAAAGTTFNLNGVDQLLQVETTSAPATVKAHATVKFAGGDWLAAEVTNILDNKIRLELPGGGPVVVDRHQVEWLYFSKGPAPECYEGPASFSGWISDGGWAYRDGALRAARPTRIGRNFGALPDQVEYQFEADQGNLMTAFTFRLHDRLGTFATFVNSNSQRMIQCTLSANAINVYSAAGGVVKTPGVELPKDVAESLDGRMLPGKNNPILYQVFEDATEGKLLVYINGHKAGEWGIAKTGAGQNGGAFSFQPSIWNANAEQTLAKVRVVPWDGRLPDAAAPAPSADRVVLADGKTHDGKFVDLAGGTVRIRVDGTAIEKPRDQLRFVHFSPHPAPTDGAPAVAHLQLSEGGEFDAAKVTWHEGKFDVHTCFGMDLGVPVASVVELRLAQTAPSLAVAEDVLVFKNGDRIKGHLESAAENQKVRWRMGESKKTVEFALTHVLGVRRDGQEPPDRKPIDCVARFRNGDWLAGQFLTLDKQDLVLDTADAGQLTISRSHLQTLYFSRDGTLPISDGASDEREWLHGLEINNFNATASGGRKKFVNPSQLWRSFDGSYSLAPAEGQSAVARVNGLHIGRELPNLPALVEVGFDVTGTRDQILFTAQLFTETASPGYFLQFHGQGMYIYDLNATQRGRGGPMPQQTQFEGKLKTDVRQRHIRILANRDTGLVNVVIDGVLMAHFGGKASSPPRQLGHGIMLSPQVGIGCTFSNLWFGPWNGRLPATATAATEADGAAKPDEGKPVAATDALPDTAVLNNGDETQGTIEVATPSSVKITSEVGPLELPLERITMVDFGGPAPTRAAGTRLHLAGLGALTVTGYRVDKDTVTGRSEIAGDLHLSLGSIQELVLVAPGAK